MIRYLVATFAVALLIGCVPSAKDYELASKVGKYLDATGVVSIDDKREASRTYIGKTVYFGPGVNGSPHFIYYEVTDPIDIKKLQEAAQLALKEIPALRKVSLHFMEKQVVRQSADGSAIRGWEKEIATVVVSR